MNALLDLIIRLFVIALMVFICHWGLVNFNHIKDFVFTVENFFTFTIKADLIKVCIVEFLYLTFFVSCFILSEFFLTLNLESKSKKAKRKFKETPNVPPHAKHS